MKCVLQIGCMLLLGVAVVFGQNQKSTDDAARAAINKLYESLNEDQKKLALKDFDDKERYVEQFPGVQRPGLPFTKLTAEQKVLFGDVVRAMTSEYGSARCLEVAKQDGEGQRYLNFFGTPRADGPFAWRFAQHHLTLIYAEYGKDKANEFGPILLGGNPVKSLWDEEEKIALELYGSLSEEEAKKIKGQGSAASGSGLDGKSGVRISDLNDKAKPLARKLLAQRVAVFSSDRRRVLENLIQREGGVDDLRIAFWGEAKKSQHEGGNYHWKIAGKLFLADWQTIGKEHIHMTVRAKAK